MIVEFTLDNSRSRPADAAAPGGLAPTSTVRGRLIISDDEIRVKLEPNGIELSVLTYGVAKMLSELAHDPEKQEVQLEIPGTAPQADEDSGEYDPTDDRVDEAPRDKKKSKKKEEN